MHLKVLFTLLNYVEFKTMLTRQVLIVEEFILFLFSPLEHGKCFSKCKLYRIYKAYENVKLDTFKKIKYFDMQMTFNTVNNSI